MKFLDVQSLFVVIECFLKGILSNWSLFFFISVFFSPSHVFFFCRIERFLIYQSISLVGFHSLGLSIEFSVHFVSIQRSTVIIIIHFFDIAEWSLHKDHKSNAIHWRRAKSKKNPDAMQESEDWKSHSKSSTNNWETLAKCDLIPLLHRKAPQALFNGWSRSFLIPNTTETIAKSLRFVPFTRTVKDLMNKINSFLKGFASYVQCDVKNKIFSSGTRHDALFPSLLDIFMVLERWK